MKFPRLQEILAEEGILDERFFTDENRQDWDDALPFKGPWLGYGQKPQTDSQGRPLPINVNMPEPEIATEKNPFGAYAKSKALDVVINEFSYDDDIPREALNLIPKTDALRDYINRDFPVIKKWVAFIDDKPVGLATLEQIEGSLGQHSNTQLVQLLVSPKARGKGIGEKLLKEVIDAKEVDHLAGHTHHSDGFKHLAQKYGIRDMDDVTRYVEESSNWQKDGSYEDPVEAHLLLANVHASMRALAKATLPEGSELLEFYMMADAEAWREDTAEEGKAEWARMSLEERKEIIPTLISHGYSSHFPKEPKTDADWEEVMWSFLSYYEDERQDNADTSETFFEKARILTNPTLVRFTDQEPSKILAEGFQGYAPKNLGLTHHYRPRSGDLAFAFDKKDLKKPEDWAGFQSKYGQNIFEFKVPYAVKAYHNTDGEDQVVFDVETVDKLKQIQAPTKKKLSIRPLKKGEKIPF